MIMPTRLNRKPSQTKQVILSSMVTSMLIRHKQQPSISKLCYSAPVAN